MNNQHPDQPGAAGDVTRVVVGFRLDPFQRLVLRALCVLIGLAATCLYVMSRGAYSEQRAAMLETKERIEKAAQSGMID